ncbi:hypothetical protein BC938DRAFT_471130 [Jimgerdemannia flammicorona]|uniref:Uncharacterized protein n=1 Tax=Jimgerdemannia flammicorona TaxID=994334 RepID=A0A433QUW6_9FUNG|nr:hypothetical protein BC938DRAFT_471130 [Jimgerdemannia flammicorona]
MARCDRGCCEPRASWQHLGPLLFVDIHSHTKNITKCTSLDDSESQKLYTCFWPIFVTLSETIYRNKWSCLHPFRFICYDER